MKFRTAITAVGLCAGAGFAAAESYVACALESQAAGGVCGFPPPLFVPPVTGRGGPAADGSYVGITCDVGNSFQRVVCGDTVAFNFTADPLAIRSYNSHGDVLYSYDFPGTQGISLGIWLGNGTSLTHTILGEGSGAINDRRRVVSTYDTASPDLPDGADDVITFRDYLPDGGTSPATTIISDKNAAGGCFVYDLNERSVALIRFDGQRHTWDPNNGIQPLAGPDDAYALNNHSAALGRSSLRRADGTVVSIPSVAGQPGSVYTRAFTDDETVIGSQGDAPSTPAFALIWTAADGSRDLNTLLADPNAVPHLETAWSINASGQIMAEDVDGLLWLLSPASCAGDADGDDDVDLDDLLVVLNNFGGSFPAADFDLDGTVDLDDLLTLLGHFGCAP